MIYMAAGNSRRFGSNKLFYLIDEKSMYLHVLERLSAVCKRHRDWEIVLVSQYEELLEQGKQLAHLTVYSPESRDGASWTIKNGLKAAGDADAFVFFTADQPWLSEATIEGFVSKMEQNHADLGSVCLGETPGNPVWFSREYLPELLALSGDQGGRRVLKKYSERIFWYPVADARELEDVDYNLREQRVKNMIVPDGSC